MGCMYINPLYPSPIKEIYHSQHPHAMTTLPEEYVCSYEMDDPKGLQACVDRALSQPDLKPLLPSEFTKQAHLARLTTIFGRLLTNQQKGGEKKEQDPVPPPQEKEVKGVEDVQKKKQMKKPPSKEKGLKKQKEEKLGASSTPSYLPRLQQMDRDLQKHYTTHDPQCKRLVIYTAHHSAGFGSQYFNMLLDFPIALWDNRTFVLSDHWLTNYHCHPEGIGPSYTSCFQEGIVLGPKSCRKADTITKALSQPETNHPQL